MGKKEQEGKGEKRGEHARGDGDAGPSPFFLLPFAFAKEAK